MPLRMPGLRWAFKCSEWIPSKEEWMLAAQCIQSEEKERVGRFVYQRDAKYAMIGRLMIRKAVSEQLSIPYKEVKLSRTEKGKPVIAASGQEENLCFNVSHQGSFTVLAAETNDGNIGVDVMDFARPRGCNSIQEYFDLMKKQFTSHEWDFVKSRSSEEQQLSRFYRCWCLKESYVKALGVGITTDLQSIEFHINTPELDCDRLVCDTVVSVDGQLQNSWKFQESLLDQNHCVAVGLDTGSTQTCEDLFKNLSFSELVSGAEPLSESDTEYWYTFNKKETEPNVNR